MSGTMTWVGLDVHARSTHAAAIDLATGELSRMRFGAGVDAPVAWLRELRARCGRVMRPARPGLGCIGQRSRPGSRCRSSRPARRRVEPRIG